MLTVKVLKKTKPKLLNGIASLLNRGLQQHRTTLDGAMLTAKGWRKIKSKLLNGIASLLNKDIRTRSISLVCAITMAET